MPTPANSFDDIYRRFEDRFRGSAEAIKHRLGVYLPLLESVANDLKVGAPAIDLGCGRGEWLKLLSEHGWPVNGIDLNPGMAKVALDLGLSVKAGDAIEFLREQPDDSASIISAFHLAEHVSIDYLIDLLRESHRVLAETGLLILETPNPENLTVGTWSFHMDPTHNKPLPPLLLEFLVQNSGFEDTAIVRLNGNASELKEMPLERVASILFNAGMDYAVIAQKHILESGESKVKSFAFAVSQYNPADTPKVKEILRGADRQIIELQNAVCDIRSEMTSIVEAMEVKLAKLNSASKDGIASLTKSIEVSQVALTSLSAALEAVHTSTSWKITKPLRGTKQLFVWMRHNQSKLSRLMAHQCLGVGLRFVRRNPRWVPRIRRVATHFPLFEAKLRAFVQTRSRQDSQPGASELSWIIQPSPAALLAWRTLLGAEHTERSY